jgi:hypothetical protein
MLFTLLSFLFYFISVKNLLLIIIIIIINSIYMLNMFDVIWKFHISSC